MLEIYVRARPHGLVHDVLLVSEADGTYRSICMNNILFQLCARQDVSMVAGALVQEFAHVLGIGLAPLAQHVRFIYNVK